MSKEYLYTPRVRLYADNKRDIEIQKWLEGLPSGIKSEMMKQAIWTSISGATQKSRSANYLGGQPYEKPDRAPISSKVSASVTFDTAELLADIRQIVETGVKQALAHHGTTPREATPNLESEIEDLLDNLNMSMMLDDDDEEE